MLDRGAQIAIFIPELRESHQSFVFQLLVVLRQFKNLSEHLLCRLRQFVAPVSAGQPLECRDVIALGFMDLRPGFLRGIRSLVRHERIGEQEEGLDALLSGARHLHGFDQMFPCPVRLRPLQVDLSQPEPSVEAVRLQPQGRVEVLGRLVVVPEPHVHHPQEQLEVRVLSLNTRRILEEFEQLPRLLLGLVDLVDLLERELVLRVLKDEVHELLDLLLRSRAQCHWRRLVRERVRIDRFRRLRSRSFPHGG